MCTMQFSLGLGACKPTRSPTASIVNKTSSLLKWRSHHQEDGGASSRTATSTSCHSLKLNENQTLLRRREAVGLGFCFSLLELVLQQGAAADAAERLACEFTTTPSGLAYCEKVVGTPGSQPVKGQLIKAKTPSGDGFYEEQFGIRLSLKAHYTGKLENGKVFDSSYNRGKPLTFRVGVGEVIKGWDQGILGGDGVPPMLVGGKRTLKIPPELGYGMRGAGCRGGTCIIPPNSVLLFDVEFVGKA